MNPSHRLPFEERDAKKENPPHSLVFYRRHWREILRKLPAYLFHFDRNRGRVISMRCCYSGHAAGRRDQTAVQARGRSRKTEKRTALTVLLKRDKIPGTGRRRGSPRLDHPRYALKVMKKTDRRRKNSSSKPYRSKIRMVAGF